MLFRQEVVDCKVVEVALLGEMWKWRHGQSEFSMAVDFLFRAIVRKTGDKGTHLRRINRLYCPSPI